MTLQFISLFFVTDKAQLGQTEVLTQYLTNTCFSSPVPNISFLYRDQLGEIPFKKLAGQIECRCLHWPNSTAPCWICPERYPACQWSPDTTWTLLTLPVLAQSGRPPGHHPELLQILLVLACPCMMHLSAWSGRKIALRFSSDSISGTSLVHQSEFLIIGTYRLY